ncbi:MAG TPA: hypothetical protein VJY62_01350 [Bacteroidia bacterium]|nr:hypothetical protein [Bacteroidia bacterium]
MQKENRHKNETLTNVQSQTYKSLVSKDHYVEITLTTENGTVYVTKQDIAVDPSVRSSVYNLTDAEMNEQSVTIPDVGTYWFVFFDNTSSARQNAGTIEFSCSCTGTGSCEVRTAMNTTSCYPNPTCSGCCKLSISMPSRIIPGGAILVKANNVIDN